MKLDIQVKDSNGFDLHLGDYVELVDWGKGESSLGITEIIWDDKEGRISCRPLLIEDAYDFFTKALPRSRKVYELDLSNMEKRLHDESNI